jgi:hypothetical protein
MHDIILLLRQTHEKREISHFVINKHRLNSVHITLSESSKRNILRDFEAVLENKLIRDLSEGKNGKLNGDNLDIRVNTNDIRMNNKNKDYHFFATNFVVKENKSNTSKDCFDSFVM